MSKQQSFGNTQIFKPNWADSNDISRWLRREIFIGETLNLPCGGSPLGDVRVDIDPSVNPDIVADIENIPFEERSFDTVYCDPPYSYLAYDKNQFVLDLWDCAKERLILQSGTQRYHLPNAEREIYLAERGGTMVYQVFQVFTRQNERLCDYE